MFPRSELPRVLERIAAGLEPELRRQLTISLVDRRDRRVLEWLLDWYSDPSRRRWYDQFHVVYSTLIALDLVAAENADPLIIPAVLLHDIGYAAIGGGAGPAAWRDPTSRITHMQEGAALAARVLSDLNYTSGEIETIVGMVAVHDNPYLGIPLCGDTRRLMRDCDRAWVMHPLSFYKDWSAKGDSDPNRDLAFFLAVRRVHFFGPPETTEADPWGITPAVVDRAKTRIEQPFSPYARSHIDSQLRRRRQEIHGSESTAENPMFSSLETFERRMSQIVLDE
jgi:hypothetical protein